MVFSYYGSKSKIARLYPAPKHERIIEPFAGSAQYSLQWFGRDVWINDVSPVIYRIWNWIIREATLEDVKRLPELRQGDDLRNFKWLSQPERDLLGFCVGNARSDPGNVATNWATLNRLPPGHRNYRPSSTIDRTRSRLLYYLPRIRHWRVTNTSWEKIRVNPEATWFVDPPYKGVAGRLYPFHGVDYSRLASWCLGRNGQVVVCEGKEGDWLPFVELPTNEKGKSGRLVEKVWTND